jgi:hypothetical protein
MKKKKPFRGKTKQASVGKDVIGLTKKQYADWTTKNREYAERDASETLKWRKSRQRSNPMP